MKLKRQAGFTLVEIVVCVVIIGLLLGAILVGRSVITSAKTKNAISDFNAIVVAVETYKDRYRAVPGDDPNAGRWPSAVGGNGDRFIAGGWNAIPSNPPLPSEESNLFWLHLKLSGFLLGDAQGLAGTSMPTNSADGYLGVQETTGHLGLNGLLLCTSLPDKVAIAFDNQLDDGKPNGGTVRAMKGDHRNALAPAAVAAYLEDDSTYIVCSPMSAKRNQ